MLAGRCVIPIAQFRTRSWSHEGVLDLRHAVDGTVDWAAVQLAA